MSSGMQEFYTVAQIAVRKVHIWPNQREDAVQYIVMKLWEADLDQHLTFKKLVTYACNKAKDYLRLINGQNNNKSLAAQVPLKESHMRLSVFNPTEPLNKKLDLQKTMSPMLEELILNGTSARDYAKANGVTEGYISQQVSAEVAKLKKKLK